ncbi:Ig-like domain-containing protein [bacterium]|nr:Ig-like domain-containing protein [bacterium]MBU1984140.1 Ig-like domain-containing protein [bacterium]
MKHSRWAMSVWLLAIVLAALVLWLGCEQKGDISPTGGGTSVLTYIDTVAIEPGIVAPGQTAAIGARILDEENAPAHNERVRFSVNRGVLGGSRADTTVNSDLLGWARTTFTAPPDSGPVQLRTELVGMGEIRTAVISVGAAEAREGDLTVWADQDTLFADNGISSTLVYARLRNENHNPIAGVLIFFSTTVGSITSPARTDSLTGTARATLVSTTETGQALVIARYGSSADSARIAFLQPASASLIEVSSSRPQISAGTDSATITARVFNDRGQPVVDNTVVSFSTTRGTLSLLTARTTGGVAITKLFASSGVGTATVAATTGGQISGQTSVQIVAGPSASVTVTAAADTLYADNSSTTTITATVRDAFGNPVSEGTPVSFSAQGGIVTESSTVGSNGVANATFQAGLLVGPAAIIASQAGVQGSVVIYLAPTLAATINLSANPQQLVADGNAQSALRATVLDAQGRPVSDGTSVTFAARYGSLAGGGGVAARRNDREVAPSSKWGGAVKPASRDRNRSFDENHRDSRGGFGRTNALYTTTTVGGYAYATLISPTAVGTDTVSAEVQGLLDRETLTYLPGAAARIQVTPAATELPADGISSTAVVCRVTDVFGNSVGSGYAISVSATLGQMSPSSGYTNNLGEFTTHLISSRQRGLSGIVATCESASGYGEVLFAAPAVATVGLTSNTNSLLANGISTATLTAQVRDAYGLAIQGVALVWQAGSGIGELVPNSTITDSLGRATATFYSGASRTDATQNVSVIAGSLSDMRTLRLLGITLSAWADDPYLPADGVSTTQTNALVRETTSGFAINGVPVYFAATRGSIAQTAQTNSSGIATVAYRSATESGPVEITAVYGDTLRAQTNVQLTGIEADTLTVTLAHSELMADGVSNTTVTAVVRNEGGQTVANTPVSFLAVGGGTCFPDLVATNSSGVAVSTYYSAALTQDQNVSVEVAIERDNDQKPMLLRGILLSVTADELLLPANGSATTQVRLDLRRSSSYVAIGGTTVQLGTNLGTIPASVVTDSSGTATVTFRAGSNTGEANIVARYGNVLTDTVTVSLFAPAASTVALNATQSSLLANGVDSTSLFFVVVDQTGAPLRNAQVQWSVNGQGRLTRTASVTDQNGMTMNSFVAPASSGDSYSSIIARAGTAADTVTIATRGVTLTVSPSLSTLPANGVSTTTITAHLRETTGLTAIPSAPLRFGASLGQMPAQASTDASGTASVALRTGTTPGIASVVVRYGNTIADTVLVSFYIPTPQQLQVSASSTLLRANGVSSTPVQAIVYDEMNVPLAGATVSWSAVGGSLDAVQTQTDGSGVTSIIYVSQASTSDRATTIIASSGSAQGQVAITERGVTVNVTAQPSNVIADGRSTSMIRVHVFETTTSVAISEAVVSMGTTLGTIPNQGMTNASGIATATLTSATETGTANVTARYGNVLQNQVNVTFAPSTPSHLTLTATPTVLVADNVSSSSLAVVVTDQNGNPVPDNTQVRFSIPPQSGSLENLITTIGGMGSNILTSSTTPDTFYVRAWAENNPSARDSVQIRYTVGPPATVTLSAMRDTLAADGISVDTISAHVIDAVGHPLSNVEVLFTTTIGNITASRTTDAQGNARVAFSSSQTGTAQITARAGEVTGRYTVYLIPGVPNSIALAYFPNSVGVRGSGRNETLLITATVRDVNNNPVIDGTGVYFNINNSPGGGDFLSSNGPIPTINGRATVSYNSGTRSGSVRIRSQCLGITAVSTEILIYAGPPYIGSIYSPCDSTHLSLAASPCNMFGMDVVGDTVRITALVGDRYRNPVTPGTAVYFTTSGGVITTATGYTDSSGFARVTLFSGNPLPTIPRWINTLSDPNRGGPITCTATPPQPGVAKILATTAGVDEAGDSVTVWATTNVIFAYSQPQLYLREITVNGDPNERTLYIGQNALIRIAVYDYNYWPLVSGSTIRCTANHGNTYPNTIMAGCPGDTSYVFSYFNNLTLQDDDAASPVLITVDTRYGDRYTFTETFTLRAALPPQP